MSQIFRVYSTAIATPVAEPRIRSVGANPSLHAAIMPGAARDRLAEPGALAVTTGQQPGLFGGPLYTIHKALAARALAQELERRWHRPVVPLFWVAGDDHDWLEASEAAWWTRRDDIRHWRLAPRDEAAPQLPMSRQPVPVEEIAQARNALAADLTAGVERDRALDWIDRHWCRGEMMASSFLTAIAELLTPLGIAVIDPTTSAFKAAQRTLLQLALDRSDEIDRTLAALPQSGTGIAAGDRATLLFIEAAAGRDRLVRTGESSFVTRRGGEKFTALELHALLDRSPERFSANVLLRPVVEAALLPTVAYVAGPGEAKYLTRQAHAVYPLLDVEPQAVVPRWGGTVIDLTSRRLLDRLELTTEQVQRGDAALERDLLMRDMPMEAINALREIEESLTSSGQSLAKIGVDIDPVLDRAINGRIGRMHGIRREIEQVLRRHLKRRDDILWSQYQRLRARISPEGAPQERVIAVAAALGTWGDEWLTRAREASEEWSLGILEAAPSRV